MKIGWIGIGRMGLPMAIRLIEAGHEVSAWNRTASKAAPLAAKGATIVPRKADLATCEVVFTMLTAGPDIMEACVGEDGLLSGSARPRIVVDCSTIGEDDSAALRAALAERGVAHLAAPVSGNPRCVVTGKLSAFVSGPRAVFEEVEPLLLAFAPRGAAWVGEGELARICKVAVNVFLSGLSQSLMETTLLAEKAGIPRHAFLSCVNNSVVGSIYSGYKTPALVNLDWKTTQTASNMRKDLDLGLKMAREHGLPMPATSATRDMMQAHIGVCTVAADPEAALARDFASMLETLAMMGGMKLESEDVEVSDGLER
jgi:3-hydroxyisobutyrate dehydrogenase